MSLLFISVMMSSSRSASTPETVSRFFSRSLICWLRLATVAEIRDRPRSVLWKAAGVSLVSVAKVSIDFPSRSTSIFSARSARPEKACTTL